MHNAGTIKRSIERRKSSVFLPTIKFTRPAAPKLQKQLEGNNFRLASLSLDPGFYEKRKKMIKEATFYQL